MAGNIMMLQENNESKTWVKTGDPIPTVVDSCETVDEIMREIVKVYGDRNALGFRKIKAKDIEKKKKFLSEDLTWLTFNQVNEKIENLVHGFSSSGIKYGDRVAIFMETRVEWFLSSQAIYRMGGVVSTLYATLGEEGIVHGLNQLESSHVITSNELVVKIDRLVDQLSYLKTAIVVRDEVDGKREEMAVSKRSKVISFDGLESGVDANYNKKTWKNQLKKPDKNDTALLMYTSGSTGLPKAVIHTHDSIVKGMRNICQYLKLQNFSSSGRYITYLPLAHMFENCASFAFLCIGNQVAFGSPYTLLGSSPGLMPGSLCDAVVIRPEVMVGVPLMLDRIRKTVEQAITSKGSLFKYIFDYFMRYKRDWNLKGYKTPLVDKIFVTKTRQLFGGKIEVMFSGGASLSPDTQTFIQSCLGVEVLVVYGSTEVGGAVMSNKGNKSIGATGVPCPGVFIKLIDWPEGKYSVKDCNPRGEIVVGGKGVSKGYFKNQEQAFQEDKEGIMWWSSGDIGELLPDGNLKIIDRKKDLIKLSQGEFISLGKIEATLKSCPIVDNICVFGRLDRDFLVAFVTPVLTELNEMAKKAGIEPVKEGDIESMTRVCSQDIIVSSAAKQIQEFACNSGLTRIEVPKKIKLCHETWTPDSGLVTAALKTRRRQIQEFYLQEIATMFEI